MISPRARLIAWTTTLVGCCASAVLAVLRHDGRLHASWLAVLAPALGVAALWLITLIVAVAVVRGMVRHGPDLP